MRNPLIAGLKEGNGSAHCLKATEKGENRTFFSGLQPRRHDTSLAGKRVAGANGTVTNPLPYHKVCENSLKKEKKVGESK